jgi:hypothetical protein
MSIIFPNSHGMDLVLAFAKSAIRQERIQIADRTLSQSDCIFSRKRLIAKIEARMMVIGINLTRPHFRAMGCFRTVFSTFTLFPINFYLIQPQNSSEILRVNSVSNLGLFIHYAIFPSTLLFAKTIPDRSGGMGKRVNGYL